MKAIEIKLELVKVNVESTRFSKVCTDVKTFIYFDNGYKANLSNILSSIGNEYPYIWQEIYKIRKSVNKNRIMEFINTNLPKTEYYNIVSKL